MQVFEINSTRKRRCPVLCRRQRHQPSQSGHEPQCLTCAVPLKKNGYLWVSVEVMMPETIQLQMCSRDTWVSPCLSEEVEHVLSMDFNLQQNTSALHDCLRAAAESWVIFDTKVTISDNSQPGSIIATAKISAPLEHAKSYLTLTCSRPLGDFAAIFRPTSSCQQGVIPFPDIKLKQHPPSVQEAIRLLNIEVLESWGKGDFGDMATILGWPLETIEKY